MQQGLSEEQLNDLEDFESSNAFTTRQRLALEYARRITRSDEDVDQAFFERLEAEFPEPAQIVELTALVAFENFRSKFNHALLVESNGVCALKKPEQS